eukprot:gnl/Trimastix_PCT/939.p1 GENE.gnl/Trimastix_PCT/939~~gnl/Trimastix_PCT/939.p1  ORF type:complete len:432 (-),score=118.20 gnl/Trimastix_PCT/939:63-1178(-)
MHAHSMGYLFLLNAKLGASQPSLALIDVVRRFIHNCDSRQIRLVPDRFANMCRRCSDYSIQLRRAELAIGLLQQGIGRLRPNEHTLTPLHMLLAKHCLLSKCYHEARAVLDRDVTDVANTGLVPVDILLYFYYGGMVYIGLKDFRRATLFLSQCMTTPATHLNAIFVEAFKKFVLASLIAEGRLISLSKQLNPIIYKGLQIACKPYLEIATAFSSYDPDHLHAVVTAHGALLQADKNLGLCKQAIQALYQCIVTRLTHTYLTLSISDIAAHAKLPSPKHAEDLLLDMTAKGLIRARIDQTNGMASFSEDTEDFSTPATADRLDERVRGVLLMNRRLRAMDEDVTCHPSYIKRTMEGGRRPDDFPDTHRMRV